MLQNIAENIVTCQEVVNEITSKRQLRRLVVLPYDLQVKEVFPENIKVVTEFSKKTGDYPSLSATDIKVMALTYQLEKEKVGTQHVRTEPIMQKKVNVITKSVTPELNPNMAGFHLPGQSVTNNSRSSSRSVSISDVNEKEVIELDQELENKFKSLDCNDVTPLQNQNVEEILVAVDADYDTEDNTQSKKCSNKTESDDEEGWITPSNIQKMKKQINAELMEEKNVKVACITTDFAMQNVLKQMNLNVSALDGRIIKQLRTFILRCYTCFKTTSIMTKKFCPKCGNNTLKRVACSLDENGKMQIHINARRPLTARGKKFSLPTFKGGKHANNPVLVEDQPMPDQKPSRLARTKNNPLNDDYIAGKQCKFFKKCIDDLYSNDTRFCNLSLLK